MPFRWAGYFLMALGLASCGCYCRPDPRSNGKGGPVPEIGKADLSGWEWSASGTIGDPAQWQAVWNASIPDSIRAEVKPIGTYGSEEMRFDTNSVTVISDTSFRVAFASDTAGPRLSARYSMVYSKVVKCRFGKWRIDHGCIRLSRGTCRTDVSYPYKSADRDYWEQRPEPDGIMTLGPRIDAKPPTSPDTSGANHDTFHPVRHERRQVKVQFLAFRGKKWITGNSYNL
jgi:hypothetical protein